MTEQLQFAVGEAVADGLPRLGAVLVLARAHGAPFRAVASALKRHGFSVPAADLARLIDESADAVAARLAA